MRPIFKILFITLILLLNIEKIFAQNNSELNYSYEEIEKKIGESHDSEKAMWKWINLYIEKSKKEKIMRPYYMLTEKLVIIAFFLIILNMLIVYLQLLRQLMIKDF